jgi:hypothetical protein
VDVQLTQALAPRVRVVQIIVAAMALGTIALTAVAYFWAPRAERKAQQLPIISYVALGLVPLHLAGSLVVGKGMTRAVRKSLARQQLVLSQPGAVFQQVGELLDRFGQRGWFVALFQPRAIVLAALLEMAACVNVVAYFLEQQTFSLVAAGALVVILLMQMPTLYGTAQWVEQQGRLLDDEQRLSAMPHTQRHFPPVA